MFIKRDNDGYSFKIKFHFNILYTIISILVFCFSVALSHGSDVIKNPDLTAMFYMPMGLIPLFAMRFLQVAHFNVFYDRTRRLLEDGKFGPYEP